MTADREPTEREYLEGLTEAARHVAWEAEAGEVTDSSLTLLLDALAAVSFGDGEDDR